MSYTLQQLQDLTDAIASGELTVKTGDRMRTFRSLAEMTAIRQEMRIELGLVAPGPNRVLAQFSKGLGPSNGEEDL